MRARDLAEPFPVVRVDDEALEAARLLAEHSLPGVLVVDGASVPVAVLPASQLVRLLVPGYVIEDPSLAAVVDERHADRFCEALAGRRVGEVLPAHTPPPPVADPDDTALELAAAMAASRSPLIAVVDRTAAQGGRLLGVVTASHLLQRLLEVR
ncbi:CBS domain-containing protein [Streptacidiphilus sp. ASG 303]|uniref:CBS domain-containing protein n=1 Tax=Streptacidiphilus sp. ASG 303 TaxID=2896847 RepID=UPI001E4B9B70|nr:CBS domain-containing protein [Streptacidiphilus sp. ASG 303]MCD0484842.1 CBS domain-containing protein [Streptacidiphilus sp. ASG 303]